MHDCVPVANAAINAATPDVRYKVVLIKEAVKQIANQSRLHG
jgi:hypothetical protein